MFDKFHIDLSLHDNLEDFLVRFRLTTDASEHDNGVYIDDVVIATWDPLAPDDYDYFRGTSMAAPHVSGLAGLIMAAFPGISNAGVKDRILNGVDSKPGLVGIIVSGGRINANNSLSLPIEPSTLVAQAVSSSQVNLSWTDNAMDEDGFKIERKTGDAGAYSEIDMVPADTISYSDTPVSPGQLYYYRVSAYNIYGHSSSSNESAAVTPGGHFGLTGSDSGGGGCFIATAAYGSPDGSSIDLLRAFRDKYLVTNYIGKKWVDLYYRYSPIMAGFIADHPAMRKGVRLILFPFVAFSAGMVHTTALQNGLIFCGILGLLLGMVVLSKRRTFNRHVLKR